MDSGVRAWLIGQLGTATNLDDLTSRYTRLGTARATALEILYERKANLVNDQPASLNVSAVLAVGYAENIRALERQIALLEAGDPPAPDDPDTDGDGQPDSGLGFLFLRERRRR